MFSAADPRRRIDYVWLYGTWTVTRAAVYGSPRASDHLAVLAELEPR
jgi:endonuclease/exonuclease/phosphatase (EEP) superfamily protein YafD